MVIEEAHEIIVGLKHRYPEEFRTTNPEEIIVLGIINKDRPKFQRKLAEIRKLTPEVKAILARHKNRLKFYIEVYCNDYLTWSDQRKQWLIAHELLHIPVDSRDGVVPHDCEDFAMIIDAVGVDWWQRDTLPELLKSDPFPFKIPLIERLREESDNDETD